MAEINIAELANGIREEEKKLCMNLTEENIKKLAASAASQWCNCYKCDGVVNDTRLRCDKPVCTCLKWRDGYRTALIALGKLK